MAYLSEVETVLMTAQRPGIKVAVNLELSGNTRPLLTLGHLSQNNTVAGRRVYLIAIWDSGYYHNIFPVPSTS